MANRMILAPEEVRAILRGEIFPFPLEIFAASHEALRAQLAEARKALELTREDLALAELRIRHALARLGGDDADQPEARHG